MADLNDVSAWEKNPIIKAWSDDVKRRGGRVLLTGYPFEPNKGKATAIWDDATAPGGRRYELAPVHVQVAIGYEKAQDAAQLGAGRAAEKATEIVEATGLNKGVLGVVGKVLGIPHGAVVVIAVTAGAVLGYAALVNIGLLPPLRQLAGGK